MRQGFLSIKLNPVTSAISFIYGWELLERREGVLPNIYQITKELSNLCKKKNADGQKLRTGKRSMNISKQKILNPFLIFKYLNTLFITCSGIKVTLHTDCHSETLSLGFCLLLLFLYCFLAQLEWGNILHMRKLISRLICYW